MEAVLAEQTDKKKVTILMNGRPFHLPASDLSAAELKAATGVPQAHEVAQIIRGHPEPLADDAVVRLEDGERFISYPRDSAAS